jgi:hypothetical protein
MKRVTTTLLAAGIGAAAQTALGADPGQLSAGVGVNYSTGNYGTSTTTEIVSIPFVGRYDQGPFTLKVTVPWLEISGASSVIPGLGPVDNTNPRGRGRAAPGASATDTRVTGLGDIVGSATYNAYYDNASKLGVDATLRIKLGTADADQGLGTGENDYGAQVDVYKTYDRTTIFGGIGYTVLGSSAFIHLNNVLNVNLGASYKLDPRDSVGLSFDAREHACSSCSPQEELMAFLIRKLDRQWTAQAYALKGFANGSPDWGIGLSAAYAF